MINPLLSRDFPIPFSQIQAEHIEPAIREALHNAEQELEALIQLAEPRSYNNTIAALDALEERLDRVVGIAYHLTSVVTTPELREAFNKVLPEFSAFYAKLPLNEGLWQAVKAYAQSDDAQQLQGIHKRHLEKTVRAFIRAGADLGEEDKRKAEALSVELSQLQNTFSEHVLDATNAFELLIEDESELSGLPPSAREQARASAEAKGLGGYRFTLQMPSFFPFMQYADKRELRQQMYQAYVNRACEGELDNRPLIARILQLRREYANLLGYKDFADFRLEHDMVKSGAAALNFVHELRVKTEPYWQRDIEALRTFARDVLGLPALQAWDIAYVAEKLRKAKYDFDQEALRPYFPLEGVLSGLFEIAHKVFGVRISPRETPEVWHPQVRFYDIHDEDGQYLASFYADWFPRESKRSGAWMNSLITGGPRSEGSFAPHLGLMVGNFTPPQEGKPALLSHDEVETTFHEFGHLLHHCLSKVEVVPRAGTHVSRDWVELPSQLMENWTWERDALDMFAKHYESGEAIPEDLFRKMCAARTFLAANAQMRQLSFATVDLALHIDYHPERDGDVIAYAQKMMEPFSIEPTFAHNHFITGFTHVFSGGYAASYYSYKWSEVLDADAFTRFQREGIFNRQTGRDYVAAVLSRGDSAEPEQLFREFMGRDPDPEALLRRNLGAGLSQ